MTIDRHSDRPLYLQLADLIRDGITSGRLEPGSLLQAESALAAEHGIGRDTARAALRQLRSEGLLEVDHAGYRVRIPAEKQLVTLPPGATADARMPYEPERRRLGIGEGIPVFVVNDQIYPADRYRLITRA